MVNLGDDKSKIDTPALLIDLDILEKNIETMSKFFSSVSAELKPMIKTHKCPIIAHKQIEAGATGIACAKLGEAETMVEAGIRDIIIANPVAGEPKVTRLVNLSKHSDLIVAVDDSSNVRHLAEVARAKGVGLDVVIEVDIGTNRCGTEAGQPTLELARIISDHRSLNLRGLHGYEGFCGSIKSLEERRETTHGALEKLVSTKDLLEDAGFDMEIVSAGGTPTYMITGKYPGITDAKPGTYVFMDAKVKSVEGLEDFGYAQTVLTTIVSLPRPEVAICDAARKSVSTEFGLPLVMGIDGVEYDSLQEAHGRLKVEPDTGLKVGDKIELLTTHCCTTANLYDYFHCVRDEELEAIWRIAARGKSQ
jgi:D-serine deaminase-like pyridoxal phosphate-dependent protein